MRSQKIFPVLRKTAQNSLRFMRKNSAKVRKIKICAKIAQILRKKFSHFVETLIWRPHALSLQISDANLVVRNLLKVSLLNYWGSLMKYEGLHEMAEAGSLTALKRCWYSQTLIFNL